MMLLASKIMAIIVTVFSVLMPGTVGLSTTPVAVASTVPGSPYLSGNGTYARPWQVREFYNRNNQDAGGSCVMGGYFPDHSSWSVCFHVRSTNAYDYTTSRTTPQFRFQLECLTRGSASQSCTSMKAFLNTSGTPANYAPNTCGGRIVCPKYGYRSGYKRAGTWAFHTEGSIIFLSDLLCSPRSFAVLRNVTVKFHGYTSHRSSVGSQYYRFCLSTPPA